MELNRKKILFVFMYINKCGGNIIPSWMYAARQMKIQYDIESAWVLPKQEMRPWIKALQEEFPVFFVSCPKHRHIKRELSSVLKDFRPHIVHTHFELYDIPVSQAVKAADPSIKMVWHIHDHMTFYIKHQSLALLRCLRRRILYPFRYHFCGKNAFFVPVSQEMASFVRHYRKHCVSKPPLYTPGETHLAPEDRIQPLFNGIYLPRLGKDINSICLRNNDHEAFRFLSFASNYFAKGIHTILDAGEMLFQEEKDFCITLTSGFLLEENIKKRYPDGLPEWLSIIPATDSVGILFSQSDCFISASMFETMGFAIAEAEIYHLPVIQSDIWGTDWNSKMPSVQVFPLGDAKKLMECMKKIKHTPWEIRNHLSAETKQTILKLTDIDLWYKKLLGIYRSL